MDVNPCIEQHKMVPKEGKKGGEKKSFGANQEDVWLKKEQEK